MGSLDWHFNRCIGWYVGRYSIDTWPIHRLAMCRELIWVEHPPMSANILIVILLIAYRQKHIGQIPVNYRWYTGQPLVLYQLLKLRNSRPLARWYRLSTVILVMILSSHYLSDRLVITWLTLDWVMTDILIEALDRIVFIELSIRASMVACRPLTDPSFFSMCLCFNADSETLRFPKLENFLNHKAKL